ncbi:MAG: isopentenyl phosphate kinase [Candidatus ainarchaeum sp.]|nr:isopentenyl phosphate kinase [Candidatus ainarchaeum sp.]
MGELVLVKLGGSLITDKSRLESPRMDVIKRLAAEVHSACEEREDLELVLGHGGGSFPHRPAENYGTGKGMKGAHACRGIALVQDAASRLNRMVVGALIEADENAVSIQPSACMVTENGAISSAFLKPIQMAVKTGITPVPYGDVALDSKIGCSIISTERILDFIAREMGASRLIIAGVEEGVWADFPSRKKLVSEITPDSFGEARKSLAGSESIDVTGGMLHKVERTVALARDTGISTRIISGMEPGRLKDALLGRNVPGTLIRR